MGKLYLFNPENDMALAAGAANYTPPPIVRNFHDAGACLPLWYADAGSCAVVAPESVREWIDRRNREFGTCCAVMAPDVPVDGAVPWGWSANAVRLMLAAGAPSGIMPDADAMDRHRLLSHRRTASMLLEELRCAMPGCQLPDPVCEAFDEDEVRAFLECCRGRVFMKSPWSSSGRGVLDCEAVPVEQVLRQAGGIIRRQGSVMMERKLDKVRDFAVLYRCAGGIVSHVGYSLFYNEGASAYGGNFVLPDAALRSIIGAEVGEVLIDDVAAKVAEVLTRLLGGCYDGYLGVDMMIYRDASGDMRVAPAIEVNLRMTMGVVAWHLAHRFIAPGCSGIMSVRYLRGVSDIADDDYAVENFRIVRGSISLVPPGSPFSFRLSVTADPSVRGTVG